MAEIDRARVESILNNFPAEINRENVGRGTDYWGSEDVAALQSLLLQMGCDPAEYGMTEASFVDGYFGNGTLQACRDIGIIDASGSINRSAVIHTLFPPVIASAQPEGSAEEQEEAQQAYIDRISGPGGLQGRTIIWTDEQWTTEPPLVPPRPLRDHEFEQLERYGIDTTELREMSPSDQYLFMEEIGAERPVGQVTEFRGGLLRPGMLVSSIADRMGKDADTLEEFDAHYQGIADEHYADQTIWIGPNGLNLSTLPNYAGAATVSNPYAPINIDEDIHVFSREAAQNSWRSLVADIQQNLILEGFTSAGEGLAVTDIQLNEEGMPLGIWNEASAEAYREWLVSRNVIGPNDPAVPLTRDIYDEITSVQQAYSLDMVERRDALPELIAEEQIEAIAQRARLGTESSLFFESISSADRTRTRRAERAEARADVLIQELQGYQGDLATGDSSNGIVNGRYSRTLNNAEFTALQHSLRAIGNGPDARLHYSPDAIAAFQAVRPVGYREGADRYDAATRLALEYFEREEERLTASPLSEAGYDNISTVERISMRAQEANVALLSSGTNLDTVTLVNSRRGDPPVLTADRAITLELVMATARAQHPELYDRGVAITSAFRDADDNARVVVEEVGPALAARWYNRSMPSAVDAIREAGVGLRNYQERNAGVDFREVYAPIARAMERDGYDDSPNFHGPSGMKLDMFPLSRWGGPATVTDRFEREWTEVALQMGGDTFDERPYGSGRPLDTNFTATNYAVRDYMLEVIAEESRSEEGLQRVLSFFPEDIDPRFHQMYQLTIRQGQGYDVQNVERAYATATEDGDIEVIATAQEYAQAQQFIAQFEARENENVGDAGLLQQRYEDALNLVSRVEQLPTDIPESLVFSMRNSRINESREITLPVGDYIRYNQISPEYIISADAREVDSPSIDAQGRLVISAPELLSAINDREVTAYRRGPRGNYREDYVMSAYIDAETLRDDIPTMLQPVYADMLEAQEVGMLDTLEAPPNIRAEVQDEERGINPGMLLS